MVNEAKEETNLEVRKTIGSGEDIQGFQESKFESMPTIKILQGVTNANDPSRGFFVDSIGLVPLKTFKFVVLGIQRCNRNFAKYDSEAEVQSPQCYSGNGIVCSYSRIDREGMECEDCPDRPFGFYDFGTYTGANPPQCRDTAAILGFHTSWRLLFQSWLSGTSYGTAKRLYNLLSKKDKLLSMPIWAYEIEATIEAAKNDAWYYWQLKCLDERQRGINFAVLIAKKETTNPNYSLIESALELGRNYSDLWRKRILESGQKVSEDGVSGEETIPF